MADQWEYLVVQTYTENLYTQQAILEQHGNDSWELVSVVTPTPAARVGISGLPVFYLKRRWGLP